MKTDLPRVPPFPKSALVAELAAAGLAPRRGLGQHFLIDDNLLRAIVDAAELAPEEGVLEVGPGPGLLTRHLLVRARCVWAVEIDARLAEVARRVCGQPGRLRLIVGDVLAGKGALAPEVVRAVGEEAAGEGIASVPLVANLPYAIAVPLVLNLLVAARFGAEGGGEAEVGAGMGVGAGAGAGPGVGPGPSTRRLLPVTRMVILVQKEVAGRLAAAAGTEDYGGVSVLAQTLARVEVLRPVPPDVFWPRPQVQSAVVRVVPRAAAETACFADLAEYERFRDLVQAAFGTRRKSLLRALEVAGVPEGERRVLAERMAEMGLDRRVRGEALGPGEFLALAGLRAPG